MDFKFENDTLTIFLEERVDSNNADQVGNEIDEIRTQNPNGAFVLDLEKTQYLSSAGLRQVLRLKKKEKDFKVINACSEVYEIFDMTGFTEMIDIEKAFRKFSVEGCEVIGEGSNGIVYRVSADTIIKVYKNSDAINEIKNERELAKTALVLGINTAIPFDIVKVGDLYGSVFEGLTSKSLTKLIKAEPDRLEEYIRVFVNFLKEIHATQVKPDLLPSAKQRALKWARDLNGVIDDEHYNKLIRMLDEVPETLNIVHGDYHTSNVHYDGQEPILIDMDTLSVGNPVFEMSNIFLAYQGFGEINHNGVSEFMKIDWDTATLVWNKTMELYFEGHDKEFVENMKHKACVVGFTRLLRRTRKRDASNTVAINHCHDRLIEELDYVEDLIV